MLHRFSSLNFCYLPSKVCTMYAYGTFRNLRVSGNGDILQLEVLKKRTLVEHTHVIV